MRREDVKMGGFFIPAEVARLMCAERVTHPGLKVIGDYWAVTDKCEAECRARKWVYEEDGGRVTVYTPKANSFLNRVREVSRIESFLLRKLGGYQLI